MTEAEQAHHLNLILQAVVRLKECRARLIRNGAADVEALELAQEAMQVIADATAALDAWLQVMAAVDRAKA